MFSIRSLASSFHDFHFDIDLYLNPILPRNLLGKLPKGISRFLGHRTHEIRDVGNVVIALWTIITTYVGLLAITLIFKFGPWIQSLHPPVLIGSLGAAAILEFNALSSPLAQPRNAILGHIISAIIGVSFAQLLTRSTSNAYLLAPLACALASAAMTLTGTLHPPGGATAVLAVVDPSLRGLRWQLIPLVAISSTVMIAVACLMGNVLRRYPHCWWTTGECGTRWQGQSNAIGLELNDTANKPLPDKNDCSSLATPNCTGSYSRLHEAPILVTCQGVLYPLDLDVGEEESAVLEGLAAKLEARKRYNSNLC